MILFGLARLSSYFNAFFKAKIQFNEKVAVRPSGEYKIRFWGPFLEGPETLRAIFGVSQFPLYLMNEEDLSSQISKSFFILFQNKWLPWQFHK